MNNDSLVNEVIRLEVTIKLGVDKKGQFTAQKVKGDRIYLESSAVEYLKANNAN